MVEATLLDVIDVADQRGIYADDGHATVRQWVQTLTNCSRTEATRRVQSMRALRDLELLRSRLRAGEVGVDQVRVIAKVHANRRCTTQLPHSEPLLVDHAMRLEFADFAVVVARWETLADADGAHRDHERAHDDRDAVIAPVGTEVHLRAHCGTAQGAVLREIFDRFVGAEFHADWDAARAAHGDLVTKALLARTDRQRRADALVAIFTAAASTAPDATAPEPVLNIVIDHTTFEAHLGHLAGGPKPVTDPAEVDRYRCETTTGIPIDPTDAVTAALIGHIRRVVIDSTGLVIDLGRRRRLFTGAARTAIEVLNRRCMWGCCDIRDTQIDHTRPWAEGGSTSPDNGGPACARHNRIKTRGYTTHRHPDGHWSTHRPDGTPITQPRAP